MNTFALTTITFSILFHDILNTNICYILIPSILYIAVMASYGIIHVEDTRKKGV